jgi:hypothetical protein
MISGMTAPITSEPSPAFLIVPEIKPPPMPRENRLGAVVHEFANMALKLRSRQFRA